jgi:hypothetical protein
MLVLVQTQRPGTPDEWTMLDGKDKSPMGPREVGGFINLEIDCLYDICL